VAVDGSVVARVPKPTRQDPWREAALSVDGETFVVSLIWAFPVMQTDLFADGRSLIDGRPILDVREDAPPALGFYETCVGGYYHYTVPERRQLVDRRVAIVAMSALVIFILLVGWRPRPTTGVIPVGILFVGLVAGMGLMLVWLRTFAVVLERTHVYLLGHPSLGERGRVLRFLAMLVAYPAISFAAFALFLLGVSA